MAAPPARAIEIVFDYRYDATGFFDEPERRAALEKAAREYEGCLEGDLGPLPAEGSRPPGSARRRSSWIAFFRDPSGEDFLSLDGLEVPEGTVLVFVGAQPLAAGGRLAMGGPGHLRFPCDAILGVSKCFDAMFGRVLTDWVRDWVFRHSFRSSPEARAYPPTDFAPWGGTLTFASDADWYFGASELVPPERYDFASSAIHELGHVLGVGTAESWATYVPGTEFRGPEAVASHGRVVPLRPDLAHWGDGTTSTVGGVRQRAAFSAGQARGERRRLTELDCAALRDVGWRADSERDARSDRIEAAYVGRRIKGDVNGDGMVETDDAILVRAALEGVEPSAGGTLSHMDFVLGQYRRRPGIDPGGGPAGGSPLDDARAFEAADVFPMIDGNAVGDGAVDALDLLLLEDVADDVAFEDADGDGLATLDENIMNWMVWIPFVGRPRHSPLTRWTDACLARGGRGLLLVLEFLAFEEGLSLEFCSRDGSPWSLSPALSPEEALAAAEEGSGALQEPSSEASGADPAEPADGAGFEGDTGRVSSDDEPAGEPLGRERFRAGGAREIEAPGGVAVAGATATSRTATPLPTAEAPPAAGSPNAGLRVAGSDARELGGAPGRGSSGQPSRGGEHPAEAAGGARAADEPGRGSDRIAAATPSGSPPPATAPAEARATGTGTEADAAHAPACFAEWIRAILRAISRAVAFLLEWVRSC